MDFLQWQHRHRRDIILCAANHGGERGLLQKAFQGEGE